MQAVTFVALALCVAQSFAELPACDQDIIDSITSYWEDNETPKDVMATLAKNGKGTLLYSTDVIPVKVAVDNPQCVKGVFTKDSATFTVVPSKGTLEASKASVHFKVTEADGVITENGGEVAKYIISNKDGVTAFYTCNPTGGDTDAGPAAGLAVAIKKVKSAKTAIAAAKSDLEDLGFDLQTAYGKACTK